MPTYKADLSVSSLERLLTNVREYQKKVEATPQELVRSLAEYGEHEIDRNIDGITDKDGNVLATAGSYAFGNTGFAYMEGEQSAYLEFGTGFQGQFSPHPGASEAGWEYGVGATIRETASGKKMWRYRLTGTGQYRFTEGIPAQMPVLSAAKSIRKRISSAAKEALK